MNIQFRQPADFTELRSLLGFLWRQDLGYPAYSDWVTRTGHEIDSGYKQAILAYEDGRLIADIVFQPHKEIRGLREIKNLRVDTSVRFRKFGSFLLRQAEFLRAEEYDWLIADFRADQNAVERLLVDENYQVCSVRSLYDDSPDKIVVKRNPFRSDNVTSIFGQSRFCNLAGCQ